MTTVPEPAATSIDPELAGKRLLILGGGLWQRPYVQRARQLGLETWVTDWSPAAAARGDADHFEAIDLKDQEATLALAERVRVDGVLTAADIGVPTAAYVADRLGLAGHSIEVAHHATNKFAMRRQAARAGIRGPRFHVVRSGDAASTSVESVEIGGLPAIVKPVDSCSSRGVRWVDRADDLPAAIADARAASLTGEALVEEFLVGVEGSIEALVDEGRATILGYCDKTKSPLPDRFDLELRYPGAFDAPAAAEIEALPQRIATGFGIRRGILHVEFLVAHDTGAVFLIEFAIRGCGSKVVTHLMPALTGVDVVRIVIRQALGLATPAPAPVRGRHGALHFLMFPRGRVTAVRGVEAACRIPGVIDACVERRPGDAIDAVHDGRSRPGHVLVTAASRAEVQHRIAQVRDAIRLDYERATDVAPIDLLDSTHR